MVLRRWAFTLILALAAAVPRPSPACAAPKLDHPLIGRTCPKVGHIGALRIAVPEQFLLGPFTYEGVDIWNAKSFAARPKNPTFDTPISQFSILVRFPEFRPIETISDRNDYARAAADPSREPMRWLFVGFEAYDPKTKGTNEQQLRYWLRDDAKDWGPFREDGKPVWGLRHYVSVNAPTVYYAKREIFYDPSTENTFVTCKTTLKATPRHEPLTVCKQDFFLSDLKVRVSVDNIWSKDDVRHWREIESGVRKTFESFVVH
jgi:hypothetical protein